MVQKRILIVDDHAAVRHALRSVIEDVPGLVVCGEAENGQIGITIAQQLTPDLIILDVSMPVMSGFEAAKILKSLLPSVPILMFTSFTNPDVAEQALAAGATKVLSKSSSPDHLIQNLQMLLEKAA